MITLYLAGGLFNAGERLHNLYLEKYLKRIGYEVILPQREALKFFEGDHFNVTSIVDDCKLSVISSKNLYIGNVDGGDADSGTSVEYGMAIVTTGRAIIYRTDFRTDKEKEIGINAMFNGKGTSFVYHPCFFTELNEVDIYYEVLAQKIHTAIISLGL